MQLRRHAHEPLYGIAPSGKRVGFSGMLIAHFADGRWKERWEFGDERPLLQIGEPDLLLEA